MTRILRLAAGGDGIGQLADGRTVFVPRAAPGDEVEFARMREHKRYARARIGRLVHASPLRAEPACPHYVRDDCGGCQMQHLSAEAQRDARRGFVGDALRRIGAVDIGDPELEPAPSDWEYRTRITLHSDGARIGLHPLDQPAAVFDLEVCPITSPALIGLWREVSARRRLLPARLRHVVLRLDRGGNLHLVAEVAGAAPWPQAGALGSALEKAGVRATIWLRPEAGAARVVSGSDGAFPATVFEQVHPVMGDRVRAHAIELLGDVAGRAVWDLYAGIGETTRTLITRGAEVTSVEADRRAVRHAEDRQNASGGRSRWIAARAEDAVDRLPRADLVVTNPPRVGMAEQVTAALGAGGARRIVYVSCDPATLARDIRRMPAYRLAQVRAFDLFPQTAHVESVALLERR
ncbi:MAG TPA: methyltransferase [Gemmatimonadales bacterium]|nr:methyltransferase [Gemmatimonadales bacterium]